MGEPKLKPEPDWLDEWLAHAPRGQGRGVRVDTVTATVPDHARLRALAASLELGEPTLDLVTDGAARQVEWSTSGQVDGVRLTLRAAADAAEVEAMLGRIVGAL